MTTLASGTPSALQPPEEISHDLFEWGRRTACTHPRATDILLAAVVLTFSTVWLIGSPFATVQAGVLQAALIATIALRRVHPSGTFVAATVLALVQWLIGDPLVGDAALLIALYTVAVHEPRLRAVLAAVVLEAGAVMAAVKWEPAGTVPRSFLFLTATVIAALFAGLTVASGSRYLAWMDERARRLAVERDQQAAIAAAAERTRIARELHDIVSHSLSVVITLADAAAVATRTDPKRGIEAMAEVSDVGREALADMRAMLGVLRTEGAPADAPVGKLDPPDDALAPQPGAAQLDTLIERVRATGLQVELVTHGHPFPLGAAAELTVYRIVQEALTNTLRHAGASRVRVTIHYGPTVQLQIVDNGAPATGPGRAGQGARGLRSGHGIDGMRERAALYGGALHAGPAAGGGWSVSATLRLDRITPTGASVITPTGASVIAPTGASVIAPTGASVIAPLPLTGTSP